MGKQTRYCYVDEATGRMLDAPIERVLACYKACEGINPEVVPKLLEAGKLKP